MKEEYIPFGDEWVAEVMKARKADIVAMYRKCCIENLRMAEQPVSITYDKVNNIIDEMIKANPMMDDSESNGYHYALTELKKILASNEK